MSHARRFMLLGLAVMVVVAGCGGGDEMLSTSDVTRHFHERTGWQLTVHAPALQSVNTLAFETSDTPSSVFERYGAFYLVVAKDVDEARDLMLRTRTGTPLQPDDRGIFWRRKGGGFDAVRQYGNVFLFWYAGSERVTDAKWERVNRIITELAKPVTDPKPVSPETG